MKAKKVLISILLLVLISASGFYGFYYGKSHCETCPPRDFDFSLFWQAYHQLQEKFIDQEKISPQEVTYGAISGMVKSLKDPYTTFFNPDDTEKFFEEVEGIFEGVGMEVDIKQGQLQIITPLEGTPAQKAGLRAGDKILKIDGVSTADITLEKAVTLLRGPKGTEVILTISRKDWEGSKDFKIKRAKIEIPSVKWELKEGDVAYIQLYGFSESANFSFDQAANEILRSPAKRIVLDLRNNPGGYLDIARDIAGWFLEKGNLVVIEDFQGRRENEKYYSQGPGRFAEYPIVTLINQGSASGAEILAGALRDNRGIKLIGETSFGKGSVQEFEKLEGGSSLKVTVAHWLTPNGDLISNQGLKPDIEIKMTEKDFELERDPQLEEALEVVTKID